MEDQSVVKLLDGFWDVPWSELPIKQREAWYLCAYLNSAQRAAGPCEKGTPEMSPQYEWGKLTPEQRLTLAVAHGWENDPEYEIALENFSNISDIKREIAKLEALPEQTALEVEAKKRLLADACQQLADPQSAQFKLSADVASSGVPVSDEEVVITGMVAWQAAILDNWRDVIKQHGNAITARQVMKWCKESGPRDVFEQQMPNRRDSMQWTDTNGSVHTVTLKRVGTVVSEWRREGKISPRK